MKKFTSKEEKKKLGKYKSIYRKHKKDLVKQAREVAHSPYEYSHLLSLLKSTLDFYLDVLNNSNYFNNNDIDKTKAYLYPYSVKEVLTILNEYLDQYLNDTCFASDNAHKLIVNFLNFLEKYLNVLDVSLGL